MPDLDDLDEDTRNRILNSARDMDAAEVDARLLTLASFTRPTAAQRAEHRILAERQLQHAAGEQVLAAYQAGQLGGRADRALNGIGAPRPSRPIQGGDPHARQHRDSALRAIDRHAGRNVLNSTAADRLDRVLRGDDPQGIFARYLAAVGDDAYASAFAKLVRDPATGHLRFTPAEVEAVRETSAATAIKDAALVTTSTGFPAPLTVDPSIVLTSTGALNPVRQLADVRTITTATHVGVSSAGVTASYDQEGTEVSDDTPTLAGPKITAHTGRAFVQFSIEASMDDSALAAELGRLIADARDNLDATKFLTGAGDASFEPFGVFSGDATYGLSTTQRVQTASVATYAVGDPWALKAAIPPRFIGSTTFAANPGTFDTTFRFVGGNSTEPYQFANGDRGGDFLGRPQREWSAMATGSTTGTKLIVGGDFRTGYRIVDRLGMNVELVPHMLGSNRLPLGVRGLFAFWRTGAAVVAQNALRYLEVK
jgi:HK97 family phage major capsid protein